MTTTVFCSSAGTAAMVALDRLKGAPTGVTITASAGSSQTVFTVQLTLDDITSSAPVWVNDPNFVAVGSSIATPSSGVILYQQPLGGIRLNSTGSSGATITMKVNQGTW